MGLEVSWVDGELAEVVEDAGGDVGEDVLRLCVIEAGGAGDGDPVGPAGVGDGFGGFFPDDGGAFWATGCGGGAVEGVAAGVFGVGSVGTAVGIGHVLVGVLVGGGTGGAAEARGQLPCHGIDFEAGTNGERFFSRIVSDPCIVCRS